MERYVLDTDKDTFEEVFGVVTSSDSILEPTFNAAPGHSIPILISKSGVLTLESAIWGFEKNQEKLAQIEIDEVLKSPYKERLKTHACIIPVSGFYKWKQNVDDPLPFFIRIHSQDILGIAGLMVEKDGRNAVIPITTEANVLIQPLDDNMPCILNPMNFRPWLTGKAEIILEAGFMDTSLLPEMTVFRVSDEVNDLSKNSKELMQPIPKLRNED
jgi:putative SOS response-associated peptidase YedK